MEIKRKKGSTKGVVKVHTDMTKSSNESIADGGNTKNFSTLINVKSSPNNGNFEKIAKLKVIYDKYTKGEITHKQYLQYIYKNYSRLNEPVKTLFVDEINFTFEYVINICMDILKVLYPPESKTLGSQSLHLLRNHFEIDRITNTL